MRMLAAIIEYGTPYAFELFDQGQKMQALQKREEIEKATIADMYKVFRVVPAKQIEKYVPAPPAPPGCTTCKTGSTRSIIGRQTWTLLHSTADAFPIDPTAQETDRYRNFMFTVISTFPCRSCVSKALDYLTTNPLDFSSRSSLQTSLCNLHNYINETLGKPTHACSA